MPASEGKYGTVTSSEKAFHPGEPVFLLRATDPLAPDAVRDYADRCERAGCSEEHVLAALTHSYRIKTWQAANPGLVKKLPD